MLYPTTTIQPAERDQDGMYPINACSEHLFPFTVPYMGKQTITLKHNYPRAQDWSISVSFLNQRFEPVTVVGEATFEFNLDRSTQTLDLWGEGSGVEGAVELDPTKTYYVKVLNMQNQPNGYLLTFSV
jgi:hypothetical protein